MKKVYIILICILVILSSTFFLIRNSSLSIALIAGGYNHSDVTPLVSGIKDDGSRFKIVKSSSENPVLLYINKNKIGFWNIGYTTEEEKTSQPITIGWINHSGFNYFNSTDEIEFSIEDHRIYYGENAVKKIEFPLSEIPLGVAIDIQQSGATYIIHTISYESADVVNSIDIPSILLRYKFIEE